MVTAAARLTISAPSEAWCDRELKWDSWGRMILKGVPRDS